MKRPADIATMPRRTAPGIAAFPPCAATAAAEAAHPDAAMLEHLPALLFLIPKADWLRAKDLRLRALAEAECGPRPDWSDQPERVWEWERAESAARKRLGSDDAWQRWADVEDKIEAIRNQVVGTPARTVEGLYVKALLTEREFEQDDPVVQDILDDLRALAGVDRLVGGKAS